MRFERHEEKVVHGAYAEKPGQLAHTLESIPGG